MSVTTFADKPTTMSSLAPTNNSLVKKVFSFIISPRKIIFIVLAVFAAIGVYSIFNSMQVSDSNILPLNQKFDVVAKTIDGKLTNGKLNFQLTGAQKSGSVLVQGQRVYARNGKTFLLINMDITDNYMVPLYVYPVDTFRLITDDGKKFSPSAHQGNVEIRPESTKTSNIGFIVPADQKKFKVEVGDLNANKQILEFTIN